MTEPHAPIDVQRAVDDVYRAEARRVYATLARLLGGNFELAEDAMHDAFAVAVERWSREGVPGNPYAWLVSTGRFKAIDTTRRSNRFTAMMPDIAREHPITEEIVAGGDCGRACESAGGRGDRLEEGRRTVRPAGDAGAVAGGRAEPGGGDRDA